MNKPKDDNQAMWIWHTHGEDADSRMIRFGKTFEAEKLPAQYTLQVCADSRYILRVNGHNGIPRPLPAQGQIPLCRYSGHCPVSPARGKPA